METKQTIRYNNFNFRLAGSLVGSVFITLYGTGTSLFVALKYASFYQVVGISFLLGILLTALIHYATVQLDKEFDWQKKPYRRSGLQLVFGILIPIFLAYCLMLLYFKHFDGRDIHDSQYMLIDFPHLVYSIILINLYYVIHYFVRRNLSTRLLLESLHKKLESLENSSKNSLATGTLSLKGDIVNISRNPETIIPDLCVTEELSFERRLQGTAKSITDNMDDICLAYRATNYVAIVFNNGAKSYMNLSIDKIENIINHSERKDDFFRINRQVFLSRDAVVNRQKDSPDSVTRSVELAEIPKAQFPINVPLIVSRRKWGAFCQWLQKL